MSNLPPEFDPLIYLTHPANRDLRMLESARCQEHYAEFGEDEGRVCSAIDSRGAFLNLVPKSSPLLEIGPYCAPAFSRPEHDVYYLDQLTTEQLRNRAEQEGADSGRVPDIDFVWSGESYISLVGPRKFEGVFSAHNIEHQPCLVTHLNQIESIITAGGRYFAAIPDKRYCFDHFLPESTIAAVLDAFLAKRTSRHLARSVLEHRYLTGHNDSSRHWRGDHGEPPSVDARNSPLLAQLAASLVELEANDKYFDVHAWQFTPRSFQKIVAVLARLGLSDLVVERLYPTLRESNEFYVVLAHIVPQGFDPQTYVALNSGPSRRSGPGAPLEGVRISRGAELEMTVRSKTSASGSV